MSDIKIIGAQQARVLLVFDMPPTGNITQIAQGLLGSVTVAAGVVGMLKMATVQVLDHGVDPLSFQQPGSS